MSPLFSCLCCLGTDLHHQEVLGSSPARSLNPLSLILAGLPFPSQSPELLSLSPAPSLKTDQVSVWTARVRVALSCRVEPLLGTNTSPKTRNYWLCWGIQGENYSKGSREGTSPASSSIPSHWCQHWLYFLLLKQPQEGRQTDTLQPRKRILRHVDTCVCSHSC